MILFLTVWLCLAIACIAAGIMATWLAVTPRIRQCKHCKMWELLPWYDEDEDYDTLPQSSENRFNRPLDNEL